MKQLKQFILLMMMSVLLIGFSSAMFAQDDEMETSANEEWMESSRPRVQKFDLCGELTKDVLKGIKTKKKKIDDGVIITMKAKDPAALENVKAKLAECQKTPGKFVMAIKGVKTEIADIEGAIQVKVTCDPANKNLVQIIRHVNIKASKK